MASRRLQNESTAKESEERYQAFLRNSQEGIWRVELEKPIPTKLPIKKQIKLMYKYAYLAEANQAMARMYGFRSIKPLIGLRLGELLIESDPANIEYLSAFVKSGYRLSGVESHETDRYGKIKYFRNSLNGVVEGDYVIRAWGTQQDVTDQYQAHRAQAKSEARLKLALEASNMGIWEWDIVKDELYWSDELKAIFGLKPEAKISLDKYISFVHPEDRNTLQASIETAIKTGKNYSVEHRIIHTNGSVHWLLGQGKALKRGKKVHRMIGTALVIDERKQFEASLIESEERFRTLADTAPVLIWLSDTKNFGTYFNKPWLDFTGRTLEQELGIGWTEAVHPEDLGRAATYCQSCFDARKEFHMEFRLRRFDGKYRWVLDHGIPRYDADGRFLGYIGSCIDIEDFKNAVKRSTELEVTNTQLRELNQAKDEFISIASHQLRTPATGVKQYIGMVLEGFAGEVNDEQKAMLKMAFDSNERQLNIINDLLKVANVDSGKVDVKFNDCDLVAVIDDVISEQHPKFLDRKQQILFSPPFKTFKLKIDERLVRMVLENLIDNAGKYSPENAKITIMIKKDSKKVKISISDTGIGIDKSDQIKLFQKFSRVKNHLTSGIEGTGLGLYWSKKIVDLHGGDIDVVSKPGKGTTFTIILPAGKVKRSQ